MIYIMGGLFEGGGGQIERLQYKRIEAASGNESR